MGIYSWQSDCVFFEHWQILSLVDHYLDMPLFPKYCIFVIIIVIHQ